MKGNDNTFESTFRWTRGRPPSLQKYKHRFASMQKKMAADAIDIKSWMLEAHKSKKSDGTEVVHAYEAKINPGLFICLHERLLNCNTNQTFKVEKEVECDKRRKATR